jgi:DNA repair exonuclease SbcCD ATPase subunit
MGMDNFNETNQSKNDFGGHKGAVIGLAIGLAVALAGDGYLMVRSSKLADEVASTQSSTQVQISKLNEATTTLLDQEKKRLEDVTDQMRQEMKQQVKGVSDSATVAIRRARSEAQKNGEDLNAKIAQQREQLASQMTQIQDNTSSKFNQVNSDVDGVKANVENVNAKVAAAQNDINQTTADLKRAMGDMGVMSGLIATNGKDLAALRALGERNYFEFDLGKHDSNKRVADITLTLKKADPKHSRFTLDVLADDRHLEKKDKTINEPVQLYVAGNMQPYEIVINQVTKDHVKGYLATPKVKLARR